MPTISCHAHLLLEILMSDMTELMSLNMVIVPHPPHSHDLAPCDFTLFPKLKTKLKGRSESVSDIQVKSQAALYSTEENDFHSAFKACKKTMALLYTFQSKLF
jgi:hypothetical protein